MRERDPDRTRRLLQENQLRKDAEDLVQRWSSVGVAVSPASHDDHWSLIERLHGWRRVDDLGAEVSAFLGSCKEVNLMGWSAKGAPTLLIPFSEVLRVLPQIASIHPDGFILFNEKTSMALHVDFDDVDGTRVKRLELSPTEG